MSAVEHIRVGLLKTLKHTLNPLTLRIARSRFGPFSIVQHQGRKSGKYYETPLIVARISDSFVIELTYGPNVDWRKNLLANGGGVIIWHGQRYNVGTIEPIDSQTGLAAFTPLQRTILRLLGKSHFEKLPIQPKG